MQTVFGRFQSKWAARMPVGIRGFAMRLAILLAATAVPAWAAQPGQLVPPKADILSVELQQRTVPSFSYSGAGIRFPDQAPSRTVGPGHVQVEWFAHSPGIPPGAIVMLETLSSRQSTVQNHIRCTTAKSEGNQTTRFELSSDQARDAGPVAEWRVRIAFLGRVLATRTSSGWAAARRTAP